MRLAIACLLTGLTTTATAETVTAKYIGPVDLTPFACHSITRSSFINRVCFDGAARHMVILLKDTYYQHCGIDKSVVDALEAAPSMGAYYNQHIRGYGAPGPFDCRKTPEVFNKRTIADATNAPVDAPAAAQKIHLSAAVSQ